MSKQASALHVLVMWLGTISIFVSARTLAALGAKFTCTLALFVGLVSLGVTVFFTVLLGRER